MTENEERVLIVAPHMDDEVLSCASFLQNGGGGLTIFYGTDKHAFVESSVLSQENTRLIDHLKCKRRLSNINMANELDSIPIVKLINEFEQLIKAVEPMVMVLPNPSHNQDHRVIYEAALTALRPHDRIPFVKKVLLYEEPETFGTLRKVESFRPTYFLPLDIENKLKLIGMYESQLRAHRSLEHVKAIAKVRGMQSNQEHAEAFEIVRWVE